MRPAFDVSVGAVHLPHVRRELAGIEELEVVARIHLVHRHVRDRGIVPLLHEIGLLRLGPPRIRKRHVVERASLAGSKGPGVSIDADVVERAKGGVSFTCAGSDGGIVTMWCATMNWRRESSTSCVTCRSLSGAG